MAVKPGYDFKGWATRFDVRCADGRTIKPSAFQHDNQMVVPLVWNHKHESVKNVLGHALLEWRPEGVMTYGYFNNEIPEARNAKSLVHGGDITHLSIYANDLQQNGQDVIHGHIREVSLVLAGANPEACILNAIRHDGMDISDEAEIWSGERIELGSTALAHSATTEEEREMPTATEIYESMTEEQQALVDALLEADEEPEDDYPDEDYDPDEDFDEEEDYDDYDDEMEDDEMSHNIFEQGEDCLGGYVSAELQHSIIQDATLYGGSIRESAKAHGLDQITPDVLAHSVTNVGYLYPDARAVRSTPDTFSRPMGWVQKVMNGVHHTPFSRIKSQYFDITGEEARALGYITGKQKKEEVIVALKRTTTPQTVYKKQKMERDQVIDITDFDIIAYLKGEMRTMLNEELARAFLIGDGRAVSSEDHISEDCIRPIWKDDATYTIANPISVDAKASEDAVVKAVIRAAVKARKEYRGSGTPTLFCTEDWLADALLTEDGIGHRLYKTETDLAAAMRVSNIVAVPVMEGQTRTVEGETRTLVGIIVNLSDYTVGADKGGAVTMFDDFDIDVNAQKYLIETRCSGCLTRPKSAIVLETVVKTASNG